MIAPAFDETEATHYPGGHWMDAADVRLDLRDVTARAHAAMPYTTISGGVPVLLDALWATPDQKGNLAHVLCRMRAIDETVTVEQARAALDWAHAQTHNKEV